MNTVLTTRPIQSQVDQYLAEFLLANKSGSFSVRDLVDNTNEFFNVSPEDADERCTFAHEQDSGEPSTHMEQFVHWGCIHLLGKDIIKRTGPNEYQHITGPKPAFKGKGLSKKLIGEAMVSVKILKDLKWTEEKIMCELHQWSDEVIEAAIQRVFVTL
jgi:hypothetical protein